MEMICHNGSSAKWRSMWSGAPLRTRRALQQLAGTLLRQFVEDAGTLQAHMESEIKSFFQTHNQQNVRVPMRQFLNHHASLLARDPSVFMEAVIT